MLKNSLRFGAETLKNFAGIYGRRRIILLLWKIRERADQEARVRHPIPSSTRNETVDADVSLVSKARKTADKMRERYEDARDRLGRAQENVRRAQDRLEREEVLR